MNGTSDPTSTRRTLYFVLIALAAGVVAGHILELARLYDPSVFRDERDPNDTRSIWPKTRPRPLATHGDNDRSRWDTVRALVDNGTYVIGHRNLGPREGEYQDSGIITESGWTTIDKVLRPDTHDFYSSKPPLLPTLVAGEYLALKKLLGWSITGDNAKVVRTVLLTVNCLPFIFFLVLLSRLVERFGKTDWGRLYVMGAACFGTFLTTFSDTLNNHTIAACSALFALYPALRIWYDGEARVGLFIAAGFFAGFTAANELPAAAFAVALLLLLSLKHPLRTLLCFVPAALLPVAAFLATNYFALGRLRPAYDEFGGPWYEFMGSFWRIEAGQAKHGIDWAYQTESKSMYAFHMLVGHHGVFSLSPIYLLTAVGMICGLLGWSRSLAGSQNSEDNRQESSELRSFAVFTALLSVAVLVFYIGYVNERNRNYGGWSNGLRWLMWLTPFWLLTMLPVADWLATRRWGRGLAYVLLAFSALSASYRDWNPWRHPWLYDFLEAHGWIQY
jgi:hypothetical protein